VLSLLPCWPSTNSHRASDSAAQPGKNQELFYALLLIVADFHAEQGQHQ